MHVKSMILRYRDLSLFSGTNQTSRFRQLFLRRVNVFPCCLLGTLIPKGAHRLWDHCRFLVKT